MKCIFYFLLTTIFASSILFKSVECGFFKKVKCVFYECCGGAYLVKNFTKLEADINRNIYGQPLVKNTLINALKGHYEIKNPRKALVLSFHGSTGVGKNYVASHVAESLFAKGLKSRFVKQFIATKDFPHNEKIDDYKEKIKKAIEDTARECDISLFIFDETDKIPIGLLDTIKAYIDFNDEIDGIDFRKTTFIFLSNSAGKEISKLTFELDKKNKDRNEFELKSFQKAIQESIYYNRENDNKGMYHASIIDSYLIDFYIPFLPLEKIHVRNCIKAEIGKYKFVEEEYYHRWHLEKDIDNIADEMEYEPQGYNKFSSSGCKRIPNLVRNLIADKQYKLKDEF